MSESGLMTITADDVATAARVLNIDLPDDEERGRHLCRKLFRRKTRAEVNLALLVANQRRFFDAAGDWIAWSIETCGRDRKFAYNCLHAAHFLAANHHLGRVRDAHWEDAGAVIEKMAELDRLEAGEVELFFSRRGLDDISRDDVRRIVRDFEDAREGTGKLEENTGEDDAGKDEPQKRGPNWENYLEKFASLSDEEAQALADMIGPGIGMRAALRILDMVLYHVAVTGEWSEDNFAHWQPKLADVRATFDELSRRAGLQLTEGETEA